MMPLLPPCLHTYGMSALFDTPLMHTAALALLLIFGAMPRAAALCLPNGIRHMLLMICRVDIFRSLRYAMATMPC